MMGSLADYGDLRRAHNDMAWALQNGVNRIAGEATRTILLLAAERCGYDGNTPLLVWSEQRLASFDETFACPSFTELDRKLKAMPKDELAALFPARVSA